MRSGLKLALALAMVGGIVACDVEQDDMEIDETVPPAAETPTATPEADRPVMTAEFVAPDGADVGDVTGTVRIYAGDDTGMGTPARPAPPTGGDEPATTTDRPGVATSDRATTGAEMSGEGLRLTVEIEGLSQGEHAWHIHSGPCGEEAPVVVAITPTADMEGIGQPLTASREGENVRASVTVPGDELTLDQLRSGEYSLHVHAQGGEDHGATVACADLDDEGATGM